jgi:sensor domain CHASE-containing protein
MSPYIEAAAIAVIGIAALSVWRFLSRSIRRELQSVIEEVVNPELVKIHERIDRHMDREEEELKNLIKALSDISGKDEDEWRRRIQD